MKEPDVWNNYSHVLGAEDCNNTLIMIQPTLMSYRPEQDPEPTLLDSVSIAPDVVLLLDTYFHVLIWHGETVAAWRKAGYHEQEGYEHIKEQIEKPVGDAAVSFYCCWIAYTKHCADSYVISAGTYCGPIPRPSLHRLRCRRVTSSFLAVQAQPFNYAYERQLRSYCWLCHLHRRRQLANLHGASQKVSLLPLLLFFRKLSRISC